MSDKEQNVEANVVSTALPCGLTSLSPGVHESSQTRSHSSYSAGSSIAFDPCLPDTDKSKYTEISYTDDTCTSSAPIDVNTLGANKDVVAEPIIAKEYSLCATESQISSALNVVSSNSSDLNTDTVCATDKSNENSVTCFDKFDTNESKELEHFLDITDDYLSASSDGTIQNSDNESETNELQDLPVKLKLNTKVTNMGNKQASAANAASEEDTPDDSKTKCCEIPKKKLKDRTNRASRASRSDDLTFESNEVYPFEGRSRSEQELNEPVELEPFEIVETDDIKFVPGAGTSDVIKSVSEPKFTPIPEETTVTEDIHTPVPLSEETEVKVPFYFDKGNRILEAGTATAHSTFEFKQVKPKSKVGRSHLVQSEHTYENVKGPQEGISSHEVVQPKASTSSSKSSSSSSSKDVSRKNSRDAIQKPSRKGKGKKAITADDKPKQNEGGKKAATEGKEFDDKKQPSVRDSEIDRKIDSVLMLTQTMFSQGKGSEQLTKKTDENEESQETMLLNRYENVNITAKLQPAGITIVHKEVPVKTSKESCGKPVSRQVERNSSNKETSIDSRIESRQTQNSNETQGACAALAEHSVQNDNKGSNKRKQRSHQLSHDIVEISESGTLIIKSLADLPSSKNIRGEGELSSSEKSNDDDDDDDDIKEFEETERKVQYETMDRLSAELLPENTIPKRSEDIDMTDKLSEKNEKENVPPPSPQTMGILEEEEEEEEFEVDEEDNDLQENVNKKSEMIEFTENVCKRLSQLLDGMQEDDVDMMEDETEQTEGNEITSYTNHIYETIDGSTRANEISNNIDVFVKETTMESELDSKSRLSARSDSASTLKRASGDSETYKSQDKQLSPQSSDDDLPDYFDPRETVTPKRDSEVLCEVLDAYGKDESKVNEIPVNKISEIVEANKLNFEEPKSNKNVEEKKKNKEMRLPLKRFEQNLISDTPSSQNAEDLQDRTPTAEAQQKHTPLAELAKADEETPVQFDTSGRQSVTCTESDIDISEHRDDMSTDSMLADDEAEETMEILFTKTYTEPVEGAEVFLSCTVVNSAYKDEKKKSETWLSDEALEYFEANASEVMSTAFLKAKKEMKDIQICLQSLRQQMEHFHSDCDEISLPEIPVDSLSPDYFGIPRRKAVTD